MEYYQHFKGKFYKLLHIARNADTLEDWVVYQGLYVDKQYGKNPVWVRLKSDFESLVIVDGKAVARFKPVSEKDVPK